MKDLQVESGLEPFLEVRIFNRDRVKNRVARKSLTWGLQEQHLKKPLGFQVKLQITRCVMTC